MIYSLNIQKLDTDNVSKDSSNAKMDSVGDVKNPFQSSPKTQGGDTQTNKMKQVYLNINNNLPFSRSNS